MQHEHQGNPFLSGLFCGALVGAAVAMFLAPKSGAALRGQVAEKAGRARREASRRYESASTLVHDVVDSGREAWKRGRNEYAAHRDAAHDASLATDGKPAS